MRGAKIARALRNGAVFLLAFGAGCRLVALSLPFPEVDEVRQKLEHLRLHPAAYDTLFLGTSRIYHQILPSEFDALTAAAGVPTHSFNAAVDGMRPPELNYFVDQLLRCRLRGVRQVLVEYGTLTAQMAPDRRDTVRGVYWHDWPRLSLLWRGSLAGRQPPKKFRFWKWVESYDDALKDFWPHLPLFAKNFANLGRAEFLTRQLTEPPPALQWYSLGLKGDGFLEANRPEMSAAERAKYEQALTERSAREIAVSYGDDVAQEAQLDVLQRLATLGAKTALIYPPVTSYRKFHLRPETEREHLVFDYSDVRKYADLYRSEHRLDEGHLNTEGAHLFTRLVAEDFLRALPHQP